MAAADQKRVRSIFLAAVEDHAPEQWDEYLGDACRGDPELRRRIEALLRGHRQPNELLDDPSAAPVGPFPPAIAEGPGMRIGTYELLEQIGEGGFGVVFMAEQRQPVRRKVALKIVKPGMDTRQAVARFEAERQALALMDHPGIAQIFDGGATLSGRPYFVMELVRGVPITEFCDRHRLGVRERLELFTHVCRAVQHAHQKGIIHRDLKPSNIMVTQQDGAPAAKIIDFGIAKATGQRLTDRTLFTNIAHLIGTPLYMSPEQAQMSGPDVDTRSDVYSLGVLLYELMTGHTPFDKERMRALPHDEMLRIIREEEPERPSTRISTLSAAASATRIDRNITPLKLSQLLRGELDWVAMKALEKDRNRRYESAGALAEEVQRYLRKEPVLACPPTVSYRLRKLAQQHRAALTTAAIVFMALSAGTAVAVWQAVVATRAAAAEKKAKIAAEAKEAEARAVLSFLENHVLSAARPRGEFGGLGHDISLRQAIEAAVPFVQEGFKDQPLIEARLRMTLGISFGRLGNEQMSGEHYSAARDIYAREVGPDHELTLKCMAGLAGRLDALGRHAEARQLAETTLRKMQATLGPDHEETLNAMDCLAGCCVNLGQIADAFQLQARALEIRKAKLGPDHAHALISQMNLAGSHARLGRRREALAIHEGLLPQMLARFGRDDVNTLNCMNNLANEYQAVGRHSEACKLREDVLAVRKVNLPSDHPLTIRAMLNLSIGYRLMNRRTEALELSRETWLLAAAKFGPDHSETLECMNAVAWCHHALGQKEAALSFGKQTLARRKSTLGVKHPSTLESMGNLGLFHAALGQYDDALARHEETWALRTSELGPAHPETLHSLANVAWCLVRLDRGAEAVTKIDDCVQRASGVEVKAGLVADLMALRMGHFSKLKDIAGCRATAAMWDALDRADANSLYGTARAHAFVAWLIRDRDQSAEAEKQSSIEADRAMDWLRKAVAAGFRNAARMANDADLDALRHRPDFIKLMAELPPGPKQDEK